MKKRKDLLIVFWIIIGIILVFLLMRFIYPKYKNYREEKEQETQMQKEEDYRQNYISLLKKFGVYSKSGYNAEDASVLFKAKKIDDFYVREGYLQVILRTMYLLNYVDDEISVEEIYSLYEKGSSQTQEKINILKKFYRDSGGDCADEYIKEINNAYAAYLEINGEKYNGKESDELTIEDCIELEKWILENPDSGDYPDILKWYELRKEK